MKVFLLVLFLISSSNCASNGRMTKVKVDNNYSKNLTTLHLSKYEDTYFYFEYESESSRQSIYFNF